MGRNAASHLRLWELIDQTPHLIWQLLTKRPHRYARYLPAEFRHGNVWLGITAENQEQYDIRWPILARVNHVLPNWVSYEPALGQLTVTGFPVCPRWVIFGGESGANRRESQRTWLESLIKERDEFIPAMRLFVKQFSARTPAEGKALIPPELNIQEFPVEAGGSRE